MNKVSHAGLLSPTVGDIYVGSFGTGNFGLIEEVHRSSNNGLTDVVVCVASLNDWPARPRDIGPIGGIWTKSGLSCTIQEFHRLFTRIGPRTLSIGDRVESTYGIRGGQRGTVMDDVPVGMWRVRWDGDPGPSLINYRADISNYGGVRRKHCQFDVKVIDDTKKTAILDYGKKVMSSDAMKEEIEMINNHTHAVYGTMINRQPNMPIDSINEAVSRITNDEKYKKANGGYPFASISPVAPITVNLPRWPKENLVSVIPMRGPVDTQNALANDFGKIMQQHDKRLLYWDKDSPGFKARSEAWSAELRLKVAAAKAEDIRKEKERVVCQGTLAVDLDWD